MLKRIAVFNNGPMNAREEDLETIRKAAPDTEVFLVKNVDELQKQTENIDAVFTMPIELPKLEQYCTNAPDFKWLQLMIAGCDSLVNTGFMKMDDVVITSTHGIHAAPISDHVLAFMYAFLRGLPQAFANKAARRFYPDNRMANASLDELEGKVVGIVSCGAIGIGIAEKLDKMGMRVLGYSRSKKNNKCFAEFYTQGHLEEMLPKCDFVVITSPFTSETAKMFGEKQLKAMKPSAVLINVGRGGVCDTQALEKALADGTIAGAGLDVTDPEPLPPESSLWDMPNVIITWHCAAMSSHYTKRAIAKIAENVALYNEGKTLPYIFKEAK